MSRLDILHVTSAHIVQDTRIFIKEARALADAQLKTGILGPGKAKARAQCRGIELITLRAPTTRLARFTIFALRLDKIVRKSRPKVVHIHDPDLLFLARIWKWYGIKIVYDVHEDFPKAVLSRSWLGPQWVRGLVSALIDKVEGGSVRWVDGFVLADTHLAARFHGCHSVVVRNYLEAEEWTVSPKPRPDGNPIQCIYVGDITAARGVFRMCDAAYAAAGQIHLNLVGPIPDTLRAKVEEHPASPWITLYGRRNRMEVAGLLNKADVALCLPKPTPAYVDALPVKILEYLYNQLPVVATQLPRLERETFLREGLFLVPWTAPSSAVADAVFEAANSPQPDLSGVVHEHYNWKNEAAKLVKFYTSLLHRLEPR